MGLLRDARLNALDLSLAGGVLYGALWLYELANYAVAGLAGGGALLTVNGLLPVSVTVYGVMAPYSKLVQTGACITCILLVLVTIRTTELRTTKTALVSVIGLYLASVQWEYLSQPFAGQLLMREILFVGLASTAGLALLVLLGGRFRVLDGPIEGSRVRTEADEG
jgi:hypothetical protein